MDDGYDPAMTSDLVFEYRHNTSPHRGLAATGVILAKFLLAAPHMIVTGALQYLAMLLAYIGYWITAFTGEMPQAVHRIVEITLGWTARMWGWIAGIVDVYPPFETDPAYAVAFATPKPEQPNRWWAAAGIVFVKFIAAIPHLVIMAFLAIGAMVGLWAGYVVVLFTGSYPTALQDFVAGVLQWNLRVAAWLTGITDEYPPFDLEAHPTHG